MKKVEVSSVFFEESDSMEVQGTYADVIKKYGNDWNIKSLGKGNGNYLLTKPSKLLVTCDNNVVNLRNEVLEYYNKRNLTRTLSDEFKSQLEDKKIAVFVDDHGNYEVQKITKKE